MQDGAEPDGGGLRENRALVAHDRYAGGILKALTYSALSLTVTLT
jgi:hypothetical protein